MTIIQELHVSPIEGVRCVASTLARLSVRGFNDAPKPAFIFKDVTRLDFNRVDFHGTNSLTNGKSRHALRTIGGGL